MALGEWISVKSSQELYENQMEIEMEELNENPKAKKRNYSHLSSQKESRRKNHRNGRKIMKDKNSSSIVSKENYGINAVDWKSAITSFLMFISALFYQLFPYIFGIVVSHFI